MNGEEQPIGEGWARHSPELLFHAPSKVYFAQRGEQRGKYLLKAEDGSFTVCPAPHDAEDCPIEVRAAAASVLRPATAPGVERAKLERAVVIAEMPKTARLALKMPLGFLDSPAAAYALFSGVRGSSAAAHWCATQFHTRLFPAIAKKIHGWWDSEAEMPEELMYRGSHVGSLAELLKEHILSLDRDLLKGPHCFSGCDCCIAVIIGENLVVATAGQASASLLFEDADPIVLLAAQVDEEGEERISRVRQLRPGHTSNEGIYLGIDGRVRTARSAWDAEDAAADSKTASEDALRRILRAPDAFMVLGIPLEGPSGASEARSSYKRLALRVHPDKVRDADPADAKAAFERLESAFRAMEAMTEHDPVACRGLHRLLRCDPFTLKGAAALLQVETDAEEKEAGKAAKKIQEDVLVKLQNLKDADCEVRRGLAACNAAIETIRFARQAQGPLPGAAGERLLSEGVATASLQQPMGLRDLRSILGAPPIRVAAWRAGEALRVALCCGATEELGLQRLQEGGRLLNWQAKATALQWAHQALELPGREQDPSASAICVCIRERLEEDGDSNNFTEDPFGDSRPAKRHKGPKGPKSIRVRHLLLRCAEPGKTLPDDGMARRLKKVKAGAVRTPIEAEAELIVMLKELLELGAKEGNDPLKSTRDPFRRMCQAHSECSSADSGGQLCGELGWVSRGQGEASFESAAFTLRVGELSDVVQTSRGMHLIQRIA